MAYLLWWGNRINSTPKPRDAFSTRCLRRQIRRAAASAHTGGTIYRRRPNAPLYTKLPLPPFILRGAKARLGKDVSLCNVHLLMTSQKTIHSGQPYRKTSVQVLRHRRCPFEHLRSSRVCEAEARSAPTQKSAVLKSL